MLRKENGYIIEDVCDMLQRDSVEEYGADYESIYDEKFEFAEIKELERYTDRLGNELANVEFKYKDNETPQARYDKKHTKGVYLKLNKETDKDILKKLNEVDNKQGYIKSLIRKDMEG